MILRLHNLLPNRRASNFFEQCKVKHYIWICLYIDFTLYVSGLSEIRFTPLFEYRRSFPSS
jgi:hypothetical protein